MEVTNLTILRESILSQLMYESKWGIQSGEGGDEML